MRSAGIPASRAWAMATSGIGQLARRVRVAVEREQAAGSQRVAGQRVVQILARRIAVDLDRDPAGRRRLEHQRPLDGQPGTRPELAAARVGQHVDARAQDRGQEPRRLILGRAQRRVRRRQDELERLPVLGRRRRAHRPPAGSPRRRAATGTARRSARSGSRSRPPAPKAIHRQAAGDRQPDGVIGDRGVASSLAPGSPRSPPAATGCRHSRSSASGSRRRSRDSDRRRPARSRTAARLRKPWRSALA